jgi:hypothetical protein
MIKNQTILEVKRNDRIYQLHLGSDSPLGEIHDVLHEMQMYIIKTMAERATPKEPEVETPTEQKAA